jgi:hypothetical protein
LPSHIISTAPRSGCCRKVMSNQMSQLINYLGALMRQSIKPNGEVVDKTIHYYLAYALGNGHFQTPSDLRFTEVGWFSPEQALEKVAYETDRAFMKEHLAPMFQL